MSAGSSETGCGKITDTLRAYWQNRDI